MAVALRVAQQHRLQLLQPAQKLLNCRSMTSDTLSDKERGEERVWFNREERRLLEKLLKKAQGDAASQGHSDAGSASGAHGTSEEEKLKVILGSDAKPGTIASLLAWKRDAA